MSNFSPNKESLTAEEWQEEASDLNDNDGASRMVVSGLVSGLILAAITGLPIAGGLAALWGAYAAFRRVGNTNRNDRAIQEFGAVAHILQGDRLTAYRRQFGVEECLKQINWALEHGYRCSGSALDLLEGNQHLLPAGDADGEKKTDSSLFEQQAPDVVLDTTGVVSSDQQALEFLLSLTSPPLQPVIIAGSPGSGKGILAAMALSLGVKKNNLKFWVFNPKALLLESGYWVRAERHYLKDRLRADDSLFSDLMKVFDLFGEIASERNSNPQQYQPFVLLLEELNAIVGQFTPKQKQDFKARVIGLISLLRGANMALWVSGQSVNLEDLGLTGRSNRAVFTGIVAVNGNKTESLESICKPLQISYPQLSSGKRYWLTSANGYEALSCTSEIPKYNSWSEVPNLIDLRSDPTVQYKDLLLPPSVNSQEQQYQNPYLDQVVDVFSDSDKEEILIGNLPSDLHKKLARYLKEKGSITVRKIAQNWASSNKIKADALSDLLTEIQSVGLIRVFRLDKIERVCWAPNPTTQHPTQQPNKTRWDAHQSRSPTTQHPTQQPNTQPNNPTTQHPTQQITAGSQTSTNVLSF